LAAKIVSEIPVIKRYVEQYWFARVCVCVCVAGRVRCTHLPTLSVLVWKLDTGERGRDAQLQRAWIPVDCHHDLLTSDLITGRPTDLLMPASTPSPHRTVC